MSPSTRVPKVAIVGWAVAGCPIGWLAAANFFLSHSRHSEGAVFVALLPVSLGALYAARDHGRLKWRILTGVWLGGLLLAALAPAVSQRQLDRSIYLWRGFDGGQFSDVNYGLAGAVLFLIVLLAMAPATRPAPADSGE